MKQWLRSLLAMMLAITMLLGVLASCNDESTETSETDSTAESTVSDEASKETSKDEDDGNELIKGEPVNNPEFSTVVSTGRTYSVGTAAGELYPDSYGIELTDGKFGPAEGADYNAEAYSGYHGSMPVIISIDLGEVMDNLYEFRLGFLSTNNAGVRAPQKIRITASLDGKKYYDACDLEIPEFVEGKRLEAVAKPENYVKARYIRFVIIKNAWLFLDEAQIIANTDKVTDVSAAILENIKTAYDKLGTVKYEGVNDVDFELPLSLVSLKKTYTANLDPISGFVDKSNYLTDGDISGVLSGGNWVGYEGGKDLELVVDLGQSRNDLSDFRLTCYATSTFGNYLPVAVTYSVSEDGKTFTDIGRVYGPATRQTSFEYPLSLIKSASGRYVKFTVEATDTAKYLIEEAAVYNRALGGAGHPDYPYPSFDLTEKEWDNPSSKETNLALGLKQWVYIPADIKVQDNTTPADTPLITDGKKSPNTDIHNNRFFKLHNSSSPLEIFFDLGATSTVKSVNVHFTHKESWGIIVPASYDVYVSDDGKNWYTAGVCEIKPNSTDCLIDATLKLKKPVKARYVSVYLMTNGWVGISEIEINGTTATKGTSSIANAKLPKRGEGDLGYLAPSKDLIKGYKDVCLLYHRVDRPHYNESELINYLAYMKDGKIQDVLFDSFLFLQSGDLPSGKKNNGTIVKSDLDWMLDSIFAADGNLGAMEKLAGQIKQELGLDKDFKYGIGITIYKPAIGTDYGDFDGDGKSNVINNEADRIAAIEAYMNDVEKRFKEAGYEHLELMGYYWYHEGIYVENNDVEIIKATSKKCHAHGYDLFWIPWYNAPGVEFWKDCDIDVAVMQPGYVFDITIPEGRLEQAANYIRQYGMGIEIEIGSANLNDPALRERYIEYLMGGVQYGYMKNCIHMYYQEVTAYTAAATSGDPKVRQLYDYTYQFIKGTLAANPEAFETVKVSGKANEVITGMVIEDAVDYKMDVVKSTEHGTLTIGNDGSFTYYPEKDFTGTVTFIYTYDAGLGASKPCTIEITVE
ncbi:MAG: DUF4855 domain-containing protein [Clostridia bacterium]|nr:DUF4855 domain-containing protein [Clostridia bacterium]